MPICRRRQSGWSLSADSRSKDRQAGISNVAETNENSPLMAGGGDSVAGVILLPFPETGAGRSLEALVSVLQQPGRQRKTGQRATDSTFLLRLTNFTEELGYFYCFFNVMSSTESKYFLLLRL